MYGKSRASWPGNKNLRISHKHYVAFFHYKNAHQVFVTGPAQQLHIQPERYGSFINASEEFEDHEKSSI
jgi:hypothetical protein